MKNLSIGLVGVIAGSCVIASSTGVQALDLNFNLTTESGTDPGTVYGVIQNLQEGNNVDWTIKINSNPVGIPSGTIFKRSEGAFQVKNNSIESLSNIYATATDNNGSVMKLLMNYSYAPLSSYENNLEKSVNGIFSNSYQNSMTAYSVNDYNLSPAATAVPFDFNPTEGAALGLPLFIGLGILRKRAVRKSSARKAVVAVR